MTGQCRKTFKYSHHQIHPHSVIVHVCHREFTERVNLISNIIRCLVPQYVRFICCHGEYYGKWFFFLTQWGLTPPGWSTAVYCDADGSDSVYSHKNVSFSKHDFIYDCVVCLFILMVCIVSLVAGIFIFICTEMPYQPFHCYFAWSYNNVPRSGNTG